MNICKVVDFIYFFTYQYSPYIKPNIKPNYNVGNERPLYVITLMKMNENTQIDLLS